MPGRTLNLQSCDCRFDLHTENDHIAAVIRCVFGALEAPAQHAALPHRTYRISGAEGGGYRVQCAGITIACAGVDQVLVHIDKSITVELQHARPELFFVHGAVLGSNGRAAVISAPPGTGKSTLTLAALRLGLEYFSDELAPIDLAEVTVFPYPRAIHLKSPPPHPLALPAGAMEYDGRFHVPVTTLVRPSRVGAIIFLRRDAERFDEARMLSAASGAARLIANTLNLLAHPAAGIDAAVHLTRAVPCFELDGTDVTAASQAIRSLLETTA
jgi:hypothetical protein